MKIFNKEKLQQLDSENKVMQDARILKCFRHQNVIKLYETFESDKHIVHVMELCAGGELSSYILKQEHRRLEEQHAKYIFKQIIEGIDHVHKKGVLHGNIN